MLPVIDYAHLDAEGRGAIESVFGSFTMLQHVLDWGRTSEPRIEVDEIVTMDEYTHDVLMRLPGRHYLAFDTT